MRNRYFFNVRPAKHTLITLLLVTGLTSVNDVAWARSVSPFPEKIANPELFRNNNNTPYYFYVTGSGSGSVYGDGIYTDDSSIAKAAVHAGIIPLGQKGVIKVTPLPGQDNYVASSKNGVSSASYGSWTGSYKIEADDGGDNSVIPAPKTMSDFTAYPGDVYLFSITANKEGGAVWGSNVYTYDTAIEAAAVHAGVLTDGAEGTIRVVMGPKQGAFLGSYDAGRNFKSNPYGPYDASYSVSDKNGNTPLIAYPGSFQNPIELPDNSSLAKYKDYKGGAFYFMVTGNNAGSIWGTNVYTYDSNLAAASVHSGVLGQNKTGLVKATIQAGQSSYAGTTANGITSNDYGFYDSSYTLSTPDGGLGTIPVINSPETVTYVSGQPLNYQITATQTPKEYDANGLPKGLSVNKSTGVITGFPQLTGRFAINLQAANNSGTSSKTLILDIPGAVDTQTCLFNYAEKTYPGTLSGGTKITEKYEGYNYRYYKDTNTYLGIYQGERIDILQASVSSVITTVGTVQQYKPVTGCQ
ncbi:MAG: LCCL domain-containing protein [Methylococcales bacterium]